MPPMSLHLEVISWMVKTERDQVMERRLTSHRRRIPTAPAEELELDAPKDHASSDSIPLQPTSFLLTTYIQTCTITTNSSLHA
jgi:hypothetical protein